MELSPRLALVSVNITPNSKIVDVGTDHGMLPIFLALSGEYSSVIATDIGEMPLKTGRHNAELYGVEDRIKFILCDGLSGVAPSEAEVITICGMGGDTICHILDNSPWAFTKTLVLQPARSADDLRKFLADRGMVIVNEALVRDRGFLYSVIKAQPGERYKITPAETYVSKALLSSGDALLPEYLDHIHRVLIKAVEGTDISSKPQDISRNAFFRQALDGIENMMEALNSDNS